MSKQLADIDQLVDQGAEFMEMQRRLEGIDPYLTELTSMSVEETQALEWFTLYSSETSPKDSKYLRSAGRRLLSGLLTLRDEVSELKFRLRRQQRESKNHKYLLAGILSLSVLLLGILKFQ